MASVSPAVLDDRPQPVSMPHARGPITAHLLPALCHPPHELRFTVDTDDTDDLHLALYCCYELSYQGLPGVDEQWEWEPSLLAVRRQLEERFTADLEAEVGLIEVAPTTLPRRLGELARAGDGPSLSGWMVERGTLRQFRELAVHRSAYQLKEADPHTWAIPRVGGQAKATMVAIQADEYGGGQASEMHSSLFADTMAALDLDSTPNRYLDRIPGVTLATTNLISMLGLHRRWRGALLGHLALFEMTSTGPMDRYGTALRRLGLPASACRFFDVHVDADRTHQEMAINGMVGGLLEEEPQLAGDVLFGARALALVENRFARHLIERWQRGESSLRPSP
jgi:hypothetical protein